MDASTRSQSKPKPRMEDRGGGSMADPLEEEIQQEIKKHKILIYGKGTKALPMCGFTRETMQFFDQYGYPYEVIDVLPNPAKREALTKMTNWPTRSEEHTSELQSRLHLVCRLLLEKKK